MRLFLLYTASFLLFLFTGLGLCAQTLNNYGSSSGQSNQAKSEKKATLAGTWEAGIMLGPDFYYGDLNPSKFFPNGSVSFGGGGYIMKQFTDVVGLKGQMLIGGLHGAMQVEEIFGPVNYSFQGVFFDLTANAVFNLSNLFSQYHSGRKFFVYATLGLGVNAWNTKLQAEYNGVITYPDTIGGMMASLTTPFGLGIQYAINSKISIGAEYTVRPVYSDNVDHFSKGFKADVINMLAFTASIRFGQANKKLSVQEYQYSTPVYLPAVKEPPVPPPDIPQLKETPSSSEVYEYVVQVCAFAKHNYSVSWVRKNYHLDLPVIKESENGLNRYIIGHYYKDVNEAKGLCDSLRKKGIHDAWVIAYKNGVRHHVVIY